MPTKIEDFLKQKKIDPRRLLVASTEIERLRREDRGIRLAKRRARKGEDADAKKKAAELKPRTGRPITHRALNAALTGADVSGPVKSRILRAVNRVLEQKKQDKIELAALFEPTPRAPAKAEKPAE